MIASLKMRANIRLTIASFIIFAASIPLGAQSKIYVNQDSVFEGRVLSFDSLHIENYKRNSEYNYEQDAKYEDNVFLKLLYKFLNWISEATGIKFGYGLFQFFKFLFIGIAGYLMVRFFLNSSLSGFIKKKEEKIHSIDSVLVDADMSAIDLSKLIEEAEKRQDFRLAIRFIYLKLLRTLDDKQLIHWKAEKTNSDFISELSVPNLKTDFVRVTRLYEYFWYGEFEIDSREAYLENKNAFNVFFHKLNE